MGHLALWKLSTDLLLFGALGYLCFQFVRSPRVNAQLRAVRELESALKMLVREADGAGRSLNDQLMRRQQSLERALIESDLAEKKIQSALLAAAGVKGAVRGESQIEDSNSTPDSIIEQVSKSEARVATERYSSHSAGVGRDAQQSASGVTSRASSKPASNAPLNIYGEPIEPVAPRVQSNGRATKRAIQTYTPLKATIEKVKETATKQRQIEVEQVQEIQSEIEDVYASAEELLRAGSGLATVANKTNLPIEEIRALSQMIIGEKAVAQSRTQSNEMDGEEVPDPRLGVMATMKRQTITL